MNQTAGERHQDATECRAPEVDGDLRALLGAMLQITTDAVITIDDRRCVRVFNAGAETIFGYRAREVIGQPVEVLLPVRLSEIHRQHVEKFAKLPEPSRLIHQRRELVGLRKDGAEFPAEASITKHEDAGKTVFTVILRDITERKQSMETLRESEECFRRIYDDSPFGIAIVGLDNRLLNVNAAFSKMLGYDREELLGRSFIEFTHPDDIDESLELAKQLSQDELHYFKTDKRYISKSGEVVWGNVTVTMICDEDGSPSHGLAIVEDISERKYSEQDLRDNQSKLSSIVENSPLPMMLKDLDGKYALVNDRYLDLYGFEREAVIGKTAHDLFPEHLADKYLELDREVLQSGVAVEKEQEHFTRDGIRRLLVIKFPIADGDGVVTGVGVIAADIIKHKRLEEALKESEQRFRSIVDNSPNLIYLKDVEGRYLHMNKNAERSTGLDPKKTLGKTAYQIFPKDLADAIAEHDREVVTTRSVAIREERVLGPNGSIQTHISTKFPVFDVAGDVVAIGGINTDITERQRTEDALRDSERRFRGFAAAASDWFWEMDADRRYTFVSDIIGEKLGRSAEWYIGRTHDEIVDRYYSRLEWQPFFDAFYARRPFRDLVVRRVEDGEPRWIRASGVPMFESDGEFKGYLGCSTDVTKATRAEQANERFLHAIENLSVGLAVYDADDRLVVYNAQYRRSGFGAQAPPLLGIKFEHLVRESLKRYAYVGAVDDPEAWIAARMERHKNPRGSFEIQRDDRRFQIREDRLPDGSTIIASQDITELHWTKEQLRQSQKMEAIGQLTGGVAHDFNNLLTIILGNIEILKEEIGDSAKGKSRADSVIKAVQRGANLTQRLLAFSRKQALNPEMTDVGKLVSEATELLKQTIGEDIEIVTMIGKDLEPAMVDPNQLQNAILNLVVNARDAMPEGGRLTIEATNTELDQAYADRQAEVTPGGYVMVTVGDTGHGMAADVIEQAFDPFFTTKAVGEGSGLGLSMVYGFVKQSGGHVEIESGVGDGSTIKLYLPRARGGDVVGDGTEEEPVFLAGGTETILVVEDDPDVRALNVSTLEGLGYQVLQAADGPAALDLLAGVSEIDLLLTDVVLPRGMNGREVAEAVGKRHPEMKALFISGYAVSAITHQGKLDQGVDLLTKPFSGRVLAGRVRRRLDGE